ncbi:hypothetical protein HU200_028586 [Digitaria exilis]|uniref:X8 domain-containing protein n=1 Tax=Digitaria exilis TaxID=1010633 RepID=A0A835ETT0_9POAL|nr:hypothetical protein HU200_028586 [Digitaria exilis]
MATSKVTLLAFCVALAVLCAYAGAGAAEVVAQPLRHSHRKASKTWCVAKPLANAAALQGNLEFACSESDCGAIQGTGGCTSPDSLLSRASVAMNAYYQARGRNSWNCFFNDTGLITITDPSLGTCKYA